MKKVVALFMVCLLAGLTGCAAQSSGGKPQSDAAASGTEQAGSKNEKQPGAENTGTAVSAKKELVVAIDREPQALDPTGSNHSIACTIVSQMFETLLKFDSSMNVVPGLAESFEQIDDTTFKFHLRKGVKFHNGEELKAGDVIFSFKHAADTPIGMPYTEKIDLDALEAPDDYTIILKTKEPYAAIQQILCISHLSIINEKAFTEMGKDAYARSPVGTGPFKFNAWAAGDNLSIVKNEDYWGEKAKLEKVTFRFITEQTSRTVEIESGGVDMALVIPAADYERLEENPEIDLTLYTSLYVRYIAFNVTQGPLQDKNVRKALNYATDIDTICEVLYTSKGAEVSTGPVPPGLMGRNGQLEQYGYNPDKARELLKEAGYDNNLEISFTYLGNATNNMMAQMLQEQWASVGVTLTLNPLESGALSEYANAMKQEVMPVRTAFISGDIGEGLETMYHSRSQGTSRINSNNPELDALLDEASVTMDQDKRINLYQQAQEIINEESYSIYLCYEYSSIAHSSKLRGLETPPTERVDYSKLYFEE